MKHLPGCEFADANVLLAVVDCVCTCDYNTQQHWMIDVTASIHGGIVQTGYFDGTANDARRHFLNNAPWTRYFGDLRYQITMRANPIVLQESGE